MIDIKVKETDYKNIFVNIAEKLFTKDLISNDEKIKLLNIINKDDALYKAS